MGKGAPSTTVADGCTRMDTPHTAVLMLVPTLVVGRDGRMLPNRWAAADTRDALQLVMTPVSGGEGARVCVCVCITTE